MVWIAERFTDEHRKAIEWLNEHTSEDLALYRCVKVRHSPPGSRSRWRSATAKQEAAEALLMLRLQVVPLAKPDRDGFRS